MKSIRASFANSNLTDVAVRLARLRAQIRSMRFSKRAGRAKPHKLVLLLAITDMIASGLLTDGRVYFNDELRRRFAFYFNLVRGPADSCRPHIPFFHLRTVGWWSLRPKIGREISFAELKTCRSKRDIVDNVDCAFISDDVFSLLCDQPARATIRKTIAEVLGLPQVARVFYEKGNCDWV